MNTSLSNREGHAEREAAPSRYVVGVDLGTTNSALAYVDTHQNSCEIQTFAVPQIVAAGMVETRETLPSFHYQAADGELPTGALQLPWHASAPDYCVGIFAREQGTLAPGRLINSAKSWLSHPGVDRMADLLPWHGATDVTRLSPVAVSARYLQHYREAWDHAFPDHPLAEQDVVLTLPASFDEVARELTVRAAQLAGLPRIVLIEEPQAAFYAWINKHADSWDQHVTPGQKILVCDIGGGTSDFTLIRVRRDAQGLVQFQRVAVGEHLILGGDNFDLALAHHVERKLKGDDGKLEPRTWSVLVRSCRQLKETLLGDNPPESYTLTLPGAGSKLIGGGLQVSVTRDEVAHVVLDGFFPPVALDAKPASARSGFQEFGLPYAADAAATRYLAAFLAAHRRAGLEDDATPFDHDPARPDLLLFNGGVFESTAIRQRLVAQLEVWFGASGRWSPVVLDNERLDLAVARGAAYYGMVRRGVGVRIAAGLARTYYIGVQTAEGQSPAALCLCPAGLEPGTEVDLTQRTFAVQLSEPIELPLYVSSTRLTDKPGDVVPVEREQLTSLPPIRTVFRAGKQRETETVPVMLKARLTEVGTLDLWCSEIGGKRNWKLLFDIRSTTQTDVSAGEATGNQQGVLDDAVFSRAAQVLEQTFRTRGDDPASIMRRLSDAIELPRLEWPPTLLRRLWETLCDLEAGRRLSAPHEARWLNLIGFGLRPGYGLAVDDWRVAETWRRLNGKLVHAAVPVRTEWWILWRRVAGGLTAGQQQSLATPLLSSLKEQCRASTKPRAGQSGPHELAEQCRMLGSFEWLPLSRKELLGQTLLQLAATTSHDAVRSAALWSLGRVGARQPVYGPLNAVVSPETAEDWIAQLLKLPGHDPQESFALMQLARRTGDRYRDVTDATRERVLKALQRSGASAHQQQLVREVTALDLAEQTEVFGEALPRGLRIL